MHRTALITGGTSGIGLELAERLASAGYCIIIVARDQTRLELAAAQLSLDQPCEVLPLSVDLSKRDAAGEVVDLVERHGRRVDVLVNSAGVGRHSPFADQDVDAMLDMIRLNVASLTVLTRLLLPPMLERRFGRILNVASATAYAADPGMTVHNATKAYVLSFTESLAEELRGTGVTATALCPGPTRTGFYDDDGALPTMATGMMEAYDVAEAGFRGLMEGKTVVVPGASGKLLAGLARLVPGTLTQEVARRLGRRRP